MEFLRLFWCPDISAPAFFSHLTNLSSWASFGKKRQFGTESRKEDKKAIFWRMEHSGAIYKWMGLGLDDRMWVKYRAPYG